MRVITRDQYLMFNGIKLISVYSSEFPFDQEHLKEVWYLPGRKMMGTDALIDLANERKVPLSRTTCADGIATTILLTLK